MVPLILMPIRSIVHYVIARRPLYCKNFGIFSSFLTLQFVLTTLYLLILNAKQKALNIMALGLKAQINKQNKFNAKKRKEELLQAI
jgi:urea transporter